MQFQDLVGKRVLVREACSSGHIVEVREACRSGHIVEVRVLEASPSGDRIKFEAQDGRTDWYGEWEWKIIEVLKDSLELRGAPNAMGRILSMVRLDNLEARVAELEQKVDEAGLEGESVPSWH